MQMKRGTKLLLVLLCLLLALPNALSETRQGVIALEGEEEVIEETLYESVQGFSFWYANDRLKVDYDAADNMDYVCALYSDDRMTLSMIPEEEAKEYTKDFEKSIVEAADESRVQMEVYHKLENGRYYFLTLIGENGLYCRAVGDYAQEAAEGNAIFFQRVLDSVAFPMDGSGQALSGNQGGDDEAYERIILIEGRRYTLGESTIRDFEKNGWTWTQGANGKFCFEVTEEGNCFYARTDNGQPDGKLVMVDMFSAYEIAYEYLGIGFDKAFNPEADTDIYACLEENDAADYTDDGVLSARTEVTGGTLLAEVSEGALRLTLE